MLIRVSSPNRTHFVESNTPLLSELLLHIHGGGQTESQTIAALTDLALIEKGLLPFTRKGITFSQEV